MITVTFAVLMVGTMTAFSAWRGFEGITEEQQRGLTLIHHYINIATHTTNCKLYYIYLESSEPL